MVDRHKYVIMGQAVCFKGFCELLNMSVNRASSIVAGSLGSGAGGLPCVACIVGCVVCVCGL